MRTFWNTTNGLRAIEEWAPNCWTQVTCPSQEDTDFLEKELGIPEDGIKDEMARYFKKHPEIDLFDYAHYVLPEEEELPEFVDKDLAKTGLTSIRVYMSNIDLFIKRSGDANTDSTVDISDAVLIMQTNSNPAKYQLTDEGRFNADVYSTGDGITPKDAQEIQKNLLGKDLLKYYPN